MKNKYTKAIKYAAAGLGIVLVAPFCPTMLHAMNRNYEPETGVIEQTMPICEPLTEIKVVSFNIAHCRGPMTTGTAFELDYDMSIDSPQQVYKCLDDIAEMLVRENADIALLQEIDRDAVWSYGIPFTKYLAEKSGMNYYAYGARYDFLWFPFPYMRENGKIEMTMHFDMGNAILSKYPLSGCENIAFDGQSIKDWIVGEERYLSCNADINGKNVEIITTNLDAFSADNRIYESYQIIGHLQNEGLQGIIGGDLNALMPDAIPFMPNYNEAGYNETAMESLIASGMFNIYMLNVDPTDPRYHTSNTLGLFQTVDYIIPTKNIEIKDYYVVNVELSDHMPVAATIVIDDIQ